MLEGVGFPSEGWSLEHPSPSSIFKWTLKVEAALSVCVSARAQSAAPSWSSESAFYANVYSARWWLPHIKLAY